MIRMIRKTLILGIGIGIGAALIFKIIGVSSPNIALVLSIHSAEIPKDVTQQYRYGDSDLDRPSDNFQGDLGNFSISSNRETVAVNGTPHRHGSHNLAVLVPYRDRKKQLEEFVPHLHQFLTQQNISHDFFVLNQTDHYRFNRGALLNVGFLECPETYDYFAAHDVDLLPMNPQIQYKYPTGGSAVHLSGPQLHPLYHYDKFLGGILLLTRQHVHLTNGFWSQYWGWGREDDDFYRRLKQTGIKVERPTGITTWYKTFHHLHNDKQREAGVWNKKTLNVQRIEGMNTTEYRVTSRDHVTISGIHVHVYNIQLHCNITQTTSCIQKKDLHNFTQTITSKL